MDFFVGDILVLKQDALDLEDKTGKTVLYPAGSEAEIVQIKNGNEYHLQFPDAKIWPHDLATLLIFFNRKKDGKNIYTRQVSEYGTPPKELAFYIPREVDWRKNYRYTVRIEAEECGFKKLICPSCFNDLGENGEPDNEGLQKCQKCGTMVLPIDPLTFKYPHDDGNEHAT